VPFTGSHVAAVLPLGGTALPVSALVVGSMAPDVPYYLPEGPWMALAGGGATHTVLGVVVWAPVWGLLVLLLWHGLFAPAAIAVSPDALRRRIPTPATVRARFGSPRALASTYAALVVGAMTHVAWDAFTHEGEWGAQNLAWLAEPVPWLPISLPGYQWAQYASGVFGVVVIAWWLVRWWRRTPPAPTAGTGISPAARLGAIAAVALATLFGAVTVVARAVGGDAAVQLDSLGFAAVTRGAMAGAGVALLLAIVWSLDRRAQAR